MVLVLRIPSQIALQSFAEARGYDIERPNYINSIISHQSNFVLRQLTTQNSRWSSAIETTEESIAEAAVVPIPENLTEEIGREYQNRYRSDRSHHRNQFSLQNGVRQGQNGARNRDYRNLYQSDNRSHDGVNQHNSYKSWRSRNRDQSYQN